MSPAFYDFFGGGEKKTFFLFFLNIPTFPRINKRTFVVHFLSQYSLNLIQNLKLFRPPIHTFSPNPSTSQSNRAHNYCAKLCKKIQGHETLLQCVFKGRKESTGRLYQKPSIASRDLKFTDSFTLRTFGSKIANKKKQNCSRLNLLKKRRKRKVSASGGKLGKRPCRDASEAANRTAHARSK